MDELELMKLEGELLNVSAAKHNMKVRIKEFEREIEKLSGHIKVQEDAEIKLKQKIEEMRNK